MPELSTVGSLLAKALAPFQDSQAAVRSRALTAPPSSAAAGHRYIVGSPATGAWLGHENHIAQRHPNGTWTFVVPAEGISAWVSDEQVELFYDGTAWGSNAADGGRGIVSPLNKRMPARTTTADGQRACDIALLARPVPGSRIFVEVNGLRVPELGDGTTVAAACYFSRDGGYTALALSNVVAGDILYWNRSIAGFDLAPTDVIEFIYEVA